MRWKEEPVEIRGVRARHVRPPSILTLIGKHRVLNEHENEILTSPH